MKILDKYLLKSFLITFTTVFVILFFIFVLQVVWLFISELAGKDLDIIMIVKFLMFKMPSIIPLVLPLSVLLASIMSFGSLAENYELAAMKSSGISLQRAMRSLIYFITILSIVAFFFANNVIPYAEYKFINFRRNIAQVKPAMAIAEGQFSEVGNYNIKVEKKSGDNGRYLSQITIHEKSDFGNGSSTVIKAKKGELVSSEDSNILKLILKDGNYYEDITPAKFEDRNKLPFAKSEFKKYIINIDLSNLNKENIDEQQITNTNAMLTIGELHYTLDSLQKNYNKDIASFAENISQRFNMNSEVIYINKDSTLTKSPNLNVSNILQNFSDNDKSQILRVANSTVDATRFALDSSQYEMTDKQKNIDSHWIAVYEKFVIAYACLLMFFIGAPLGAIIRKGGLGLPIVFAILIFITFHFINTFGKKVAQEDGITPFLGCWLSSFILTPFAIFLTKKATDDKGISINLEGLTAFINRFNPFKNEEEIVIIPERKTEEVTNKITKEITPKETVTLSDIDFTQIEKHNKHYGVFSKIAISCYILLAGLTITLGKPEGNTAILIFFLVALVLYVAVYKSHSHLNQIGTIIKRKADLNTYLVLLAAFPFFFLFYIYNRSYLKQVLTESKKMSDGL